MMSPTPSFKYWKNDLRIAINENKIFKASWLLNEGKKNLVFTMNTSDSEIRDPSLTMPPSLEKRRRNNTLFTKEDECWIKKFDSPISRKQAEFAFVRSFSSANTKGTLYAPKKDIPEELQKFRMMDFDDFTHYARKCKLSNGYDVSGCSGRLSGGIQEIKNPGKGGDRAAIFAVAKYNSDQKRNLEFVELVRVNVQGVSGGMMYLTLKAIDDKDRKVKNFRAKVWIHVGGKPTLEEFMKEPKVPPDKQVRPPFNVFVDELRKSPELASAKYKRVLKTASLKWKSMSAQDKEIYKKIADADPLEMGTQKS